MKEMRRKQKEITDRKVIDEIISKADVFHLAMADGNIPYVVPLSFGYDGSAIYFHCAKEGLKMDFIRKNPLVCFEFMTDVKYGPVQLPCNASVSFNCVIGWGKCEQLEGDEARRNALDIITGQYAKGPFEYNPGVFRHTTVVKINITEIKGRKD